MGTENNKLQSKKVTTHHPNQTNKQKENHNSNYKQLAFMYTNADQLKNKMDELELRTSELKPDIIAITEVKPKRPNCLINIAEYSLSGYNITAHNRGIIIYTKNTLLATEIEFKSTFSEYILIYIKLHGNHKILFGCVYRSDSGTTENNDALLKLVQNITQIKYPNIVLVGDFNLSKINWDNWSTANNNPTHYHFKFIEAIRHTFTSQLVTEPTRGRGQIIHIY